MMRNRDRARALEPSRAFLGGACLAWLLLAGVLAAASRARADESEVVGLDEEQAFQAASAAVAPAVVRVEV